MVITSLLMEQIPPANVFLRQADVPHLHRDQLRVVNVLRGQSRCNSQNEITAMINRILKIMRQQNAHIFDDINHETEAVSLADSILGAITDYVADTAPITINVSEATVKILLTDGYYRSIFEINKKGEAYTEARRRWESECFLNLYNLKTVSSFDRPKYGALNYLNSPAGIPPAFAYGEWFFTLKSDPQVRKRITLATGDTAVSRCLGVLDHCMHVLKHLTDAELSSIIRVATNQNSSLSYPPGSSYREVQIHGDVKLDRDIECLNIPMKEIDNITAVMFAKKFNVEIRYF